MAKTLIFDNANADLWLHVTEGIVHLQFNRAVSGRAFRKCVDEGVALVEKRGATKWLSDDRRNSRLGEADIGWFKDDWQPRAMAAGLKHWAVVVSAQRMDEMIAAECLVTAKSRGLNARVFADPEEALAWLTRL